MKPLVDPILRSGALVALALAGGCAHVWVDAEGQRHFLGLMHLTLPPAQRPVAAETLRVQTLGLGWTHAEAGSALVLGYADTTLGFLRDGACLAPDAGRTEAIK